MYPILFQFEIPFTDFGVISVFFHGILTALGFVIAVLWFLRHAQNQHLHLEFFLDHFFALLFWGVVGARLGYVYLFFVRYQHDPMTMLYLWDGGFLLWSGIIFFLLALLYFTARQKEKIGQWMDVLVPASILAMLFESIGAFLGGNNYGKPTELPWGISFENAEVPYTIPIHPVQLYLFFSLLIVMMVISVLHQR
ncbi:MAG: prolipoprotein diacylglyceryl transferase, partial [bacterium]|nr:prolipoprotein diacylglyceryl transferase [bacterium]